MISLETVASEIFQIIRSFDYTTVMYDDDGNEVYEPSEARRFFILPRNMLLSLIDDGDDSSIKLYLSKSTKAKYIKGFIDTLRTTATKDNMIWLVTQKDTELKPSDFATKSAVNESRKTKMDIFEGMYGTSRSSYLTLENAKLIVRHDGKINENSIGGRSRNIKKIFIENAQGERMLFPTRQLIPARAELQHVNQGGNFNDAISQQIMRMANDFSNLSIASTEIACAAPMLGESAMRIREACRCKMMEMKKCFERLSRPFGYKMESKKMNETVLTENEDQPLDISPLKEVLTCEGFELSESVLKSIAEAVKSVAEALTAGTPVQRPNQSEEDYLASLEEPTYKRREKAAQDAQDALGGGSKLRTVKDGPSDVNEADEDYSDDEEPIEKVRKGPEQVSILGKLVDKSAWQDLLSDKLDLSREPDMSIMPRFTSDEAKRSFMLSKIVPYIKNDSMLNLLSYFSDMIENPRLNPDVRKKMNKVISYAIKIAKVPDEAEPELVNNEVVREFNEWMEQFDVSNMLSENGTFNPDGSYNTDGDNAVDFDERDYDDSNEESSLEESDPYEGEEELHDAQNEATDDFDVNDFLNDYGDELYWDQGKFDTTGLEDEDLKFEKSYVKSLVQHYLEARVYDKTGQDVDMKEFVQYVWDKVEPLLIDAGHILTEFADVSLTFSHTDIIIPTNQGDDLEREVTKPSSIDPFTGHEVPVDDDYITRIRTLAGMPWNR